MILLEQLRPGNNIELFWWLLDVEQLMFWGKILYMRTNEPRRFEIIMIDLVCVSQFISGCVFSSFYDLLPLFDTTLL